MTERTADLHLHSDRSDGTVPAAEVAGRAAAAGLAAFALTDHDTVAGIAEARAAAETLGLALAPGIEISAYDEARGTVHVLGYFLREDDPELVASLERFRRRRAERAREMVERLNRLGVGVTYEEVSAQAPHGLVARPHVAQALVAGGWVKSWEEAFGRYIADGRPAYVPTRHATPQEAIDAIHAAGGVAVLAHPGPRATDDWIRSLRELGLDGLEVLHPEHGRADARRFRRLARRLQLVPTGGSDWHGLRDARHAALGSQNVPYEYYLALKACAEARRA